MGQMQNVIREISAYAGAQVGAEAADATAIPGLLQVV
jgi:hypothetical protein